MKSRVRTVSSPVVEETNMSSELNTAAPTCRHTQVRLVLSPWTRLSLFLMCFFVLSKKKKRKSQKVPLEMTRDHSPNSGLTPGKLAPLFCSLCVEVSQYHTDLAGIVNGYWITGTAESNLDVFGFPSRCQQCVFRVPGSENSFPSVSSEGLPAPSGPGPGSSTGGRPSC